MAKRKLSVREVERLDNTSIAGAIGNADPGAHGVATLDCPTTCLAETFCCEPPPTTACPTTGGCAIADVVRDTVDTEVR